MIFQSTSIFCSHLSHSSIFHQQRVNLGFSERKSLQELTQIGLQSFVLFFSLKFSEIVRSKEYIFSQGLPALTAIIVSYQQLQRLAANTYLKLPRPKYLQLNENPLNLFRQICYLLGNQQKYKMLKLKNGKNNPEINHQSHCIVSPLKIANFNLNIKYPAYTARRYSQQQKIMSRRQMVSSPFSLHKEDQIFKGYNRFAAHQVKEPPEIQETTEIKSFSPDIDNFSPFLKDKLMEIRTFIYRNTHSTKPNQQHHINFSQLAMLQQQPKPPSVLHARMRKECPLARASQTRVAINSVKTMRRSNTSSDTFKSIEVNNNSKYGCTTKIGLSGCKVKNKEMSQLKKKLENQLRRKTSRSSTFGANRKDRYQNEYQPWQIKKGEQGEQEHFQLQC